MSILHRDNELHIPPKSTLENALALMEEIERLKNERLKLHARLGYCYSQMNNALVQPLMTYETWIEAIDEVISK